MARTPIDLYAFGAQSKGPRLPCSGIDFFPDHEEMMGPESPADAKGASVFANIAGCPLTGGYFLLPAGTELPEELDVIADGQDVDPQSQYAPTHHTIYPCQRIKWVRFVEMIASLPWQYAGKKK